MGGPSPLCGSVWNLFHLAKCETTEEFETVKAALAGSCLMDRLIKQTDQRVQWSVASTNLSARIQSL